MFMQSTGSGQKMPKDLKVLEKKNFSWNISILILSCNLQILKIAILSLFLPLWMKSKGSNIFERATANDQTKKVKCIHS